MRAELTYGKRAQKARHMICAMELMSLVSCAAADLDARLCLAICMHAMLICLTTDMFRPANTLLLDADMCAVRCRAHYTKERVEQHILF